MPEGVNNFVYICEVIKEFEKYKGIHPGVVLERILAKRKLSKRAFALALPEHPQTLNAITKGRRALNTALALKIEHALDLEEGTLMTLQVFFEIKKEKETQHARISPNLGILRKILFWDTDINKIDWDKHYPYIIQRIFERGTLEEKREILRFYGEDKVKAITGKAKVEKNVMPIMPHLKPK